MSLQEYKSGGLGYLLDNTQDVGRRREQQILCKRLGISRAQCRKRIKNSQCPAINRWRILFMLMAKLKVTDEG